MMEGVQGVVIDAYGFKTGLYVGVAVSLTFFIGSFLLPETGEKKEDKNTIIKEANEHGHEPCKKTAIYD